MTATWHKSTRSVNNANCVEVRNTLNEIRDSKNTTGPTLHADVRRLTRSINNGEVGRPGPVT